MESMIYQFKLVTEGYTLPIGGSYVKQESPKGELGLYLVSDNTNKPMAILVSLFNFWKISNHYFVSDKGY